MMETDKNRKMAVVNGAKSDERSVQFFQAAASPIVGGNTAIKNDGFHRDSTHVVQEVNANLEMLEDLQARMGFMLSEINKVVKRA